MAVEGISNITSFNARARSYQFNKRIEVEDTLKLIRIPFTKHSIGSSVQRKIVKGINETIKKKIFPRFLQVFYVFQNLQFPLFDHGFFLILQPRADVFAPLHGQK